MGSMARSKCRLILHALLTINEIKACRQRQFNSIVTAKVQRARKKLKNHSLDYKWQDSKNMHHTSPHLTPHRSCSFVRRADETDLTVNRNPWHKSFLVLIQHGSFWVLFRSNFQIKGSRINGVTSNQLDISGNTAFLRAFWNIKTIFYEMVWDGQRLL